MEIVILGMSSGISASTASSVSGNFFASVNDDATTHRLWQVISRPIIDCGGCHGVREVCHALSQSAVAAGNDKAELATARNAMSSARAGHCSRARRRTNVEAASDTAQCVFAYAALKQSSDSQTHFRLSCRPNPDSCMRNDISRIFVSRGSTHVT
ncbi:hypothetical protein [Burkholderia multivorans]|uniref:hypothetical protein n=1 Tax=Burkholderia multivorans TaxID=87883 RepID=UPI001C23CEB4|nr:hypothetical protein [Burkholderia multivorans]MCO1367089.1 hypothetical protein [Burkholderia multivorans]MCO1376698.1 hypothetical protein [Burkholderia multivorans]UQP86618.1 hypothetical protein L0Y91_10235 [Burkholderia multivorans]